MKRCPQCHFTFEDHEQLCDFDGTELTPFPESPPQNPSLLLEGSLVARLVRSRVFMAIMALAGVIASALLMGFYDAANQSNLDRPGNRQSGAAVVSLAPPPSPPAPADVPNKPQAQSRALRRAQSRVKPRALTRVRRLDQYRVQPRAPRQILVAAEPAAETLTRQPGTLPGKLPSPVSAQPVAAILPGTQAPPATPTRQQTTAFEYVPDEKESPPIVILKKTGNVLKKTIGFLKKPFER